MCKFYISGRVSNIDHHLEHIGSPNRLRWLGYRPRSGKFQSQSKLGEQSVSIDLQRLCGKIYGEVMIKFAWLISTKGSLISGLWQRKTGFHGRKIRPLPPVKEITGKKKEVPYLMLTCPYEGPPRPIIPCTNRRSQYGPSITELYYNKLMSFAINLTSFILSLFLEFSCDRIFVSKRASKVFIRSV